MFKVGDYVILNIVLIQVLQVEHNNKESREMCRGTVTRVNELYPSSGTTSYNVAWETLNIPTSNLYYAHELELDIERTREIKLNSILECHT